MISLKVAVCGATGKQGGAVIDALLRRNDYPVRALTRNPESEAAKGLEARGVEVGSAQRPAACPPASGDRFTMFGCRWSRQTSTG